MHSTQNGLIPSHPDHHLEALILGRRLSGWVRLMRTLEAGSSVTLQMAGAGACLAEASLSTEHYQCDAIAETEATVLILPKHEVLAALSSNAAESLAVAMVLATELRELRTMLELRSIHSASARLLAWLRLHAEGNPPAVSLQRT